MLCTTYSAIKMYSTLDVPEMNGKTIDLLTLCCLNFNIVVEYACYEMMQHTENLQFHLRKSFICDLQANDACRWVEAGAHTYECAVSIITYLSVNLYYDRRKRSAQCRYLCMPDLIFTYCQKQGVKLMCSKVLSPPTLMSSNTISSCFLHHHHEIYSLPWFLWKDSASTSLADWKKGHAGIEERKDLHVAVHHVMSQWHGT